MHFAILIISPSQIGFSVVSLIFVGNCAVSMRPNFNLCLLLVANSHLLKGFLIGATLNVWLNDRFGFGKAILLGALCQLAGYIAIAPCPPFPVLVCANVVVGFGNAIQVRHKYIRRNILTYSFRMPRRTDLLGACMNICRQSLGFCMGHMVR